MEKEDGTVGVTSAEDPPPPYSVRDPGSNETDDPMKTLAEAEAILRTYEDRDVSGPEGDQTLSKKEQFPVDSGEVDRLLAEVRSHKLPKIRDPGYPHCELSVWGHLWPPLTLAPTQLL